MWAAAKLGPIVRSDWQQLDHDVRAIAALWGEEEDNDHALAHRLITDTVRWGHRSLERTEVRSDGAYIHHPRSSSPMIEYAREGI